MFYTMREIVLKKDDVIVFQGDSVTDCNRSKDDNSYLGDGYVTLIAAKLLSQYSDLNLKIYNKGFSGDRIYDLKERWQNDCLSLKPTVLSILIGINDTWRRFDSGILSPKEEFRDTYRKLIEQAIETSNPLLVLMDPFVLPFPEDRLAWREDLNERIEVVRQLAKEYNAVYLPLDSLFAQAAIDTNYDYWCIDGVHPTLAGHGLIASAWLDYVKVK